MRNTTFIVKVNRGGTLKPEYVQRIDRTLILVTSDRKLALVMGRFTAEDAIKSIETFRCCRAGVRSGQRLIRHLTERQIPEILFRSGGTMYGHEHRSHGARFILAVSSERQGEVQIIMECIRTGQRVQHLETHCHE